MISAKFTLTFLFAVLFFSCSTTHYYLVRHAEKLDNSKNPELSLAGRTRANTLRDSLLSANIDLLFATPYKRTQQTLQPLSEALNIPVTTYGTDTTFLFVEYLKKYKNKNIAIAGHSNTVPEMVLHFTGDTVHIGHHEYYHLFLVKKRKNIFGEKYELSEKKYGVYDF